MECTCYNRHSSSTMCLFTCNTVYGSKGVMFGGTTINQDNSYYDVNDLYLFECSQNTIVSCLVTGGAREYDHTHITDIPVTGSDVTCGHRCDN